jgi:hypothetical protein
MKQLADNIGYWQNYPAIGTDKQLFYLKKERQWI